MKYLLITFGFLFILLLHSCRDKIINNASQSIKLNILTEQYKKIGISGFVERIEYTILENKKGNLLGGIDKAILDNDVLYVLDNKTKKISAFSISGHFKFQINSFGKGPEEYLDLSDFIINRATSEIEVWDNGNRKILVYDKIGEYKREIPFDLRMENFARMKDNSIICYTCNYPNYDYRGIKNAYNIYHVDYEGNVINTWLPIGNMNSLTLLEGNMFYEYNNGVNVTIPFDQNVYFIDSKECKVKYQINFQNYSLPEDILEDYSKVKREDNIAISNASIRIMNLINESNYALGIYNLLENSKYFFFQYNVTGIGSFTVIYNKLTEIAFIGIPENDLDNGLFGTPILMDNEFLYSYVFPYELIDLKHSSRLSNVDSTINGYFSPNISFTNLEEFDNPIIIKMRLK